MSPKLKRSLSKINSPQSSLQEFRVHPERFLSATNRYLPLLRRQMTDIDPKDKAELMRKQRSSISPPISRLSDGSDLTYDEAKSFLSEDADLGFVKFNLLKGFSYSFLYRKSTSRTPSPAWLPKDRKQSKKPRPSSKIDMMQTDIDDGAERKLAMTRYRDREYARLNELIQSNQIQQILEPFSKVKTDEYIPTDVEQSKVANAQQQSIKKSSEQSSSKMAKLRQLNDIIHSIDSLRCSDAVDRHARRKVDLEKNRAKLGILIF